MLRGRFLALNLSLSKRAVSLMVQGQVIRHRKLIIVAVFVYLVLNLAFVNAQHVVCACFCLLRWYTFHELFMYISLCH